MNRKTYKSNQISFVIECIGGFLMQPIDIALAIGISGFSVIMLIISLYSFIKTRVGKLLPVSIAFLLFFIKGIYLVYQVFDEVFLGTPMRIVLILDFVIIIFIYIAVAKR
jgi:hypothetical protein